MRKCLYKRAYTTELRGELTNQIVSEVEPVGHLEEVRCTKMACIMYVQMEPVNSFNDFRPKWQMTFRLQHIYHEGGPGLHNRGSDQGWGGCHLNPTS